MGLDASALTPDRETRRVALASIAITALIALVLAWQRLDAGNPFELPIFRHLILFQDYYLLPACVAVLFAALAPPVRALGLGLAGWIGRNPGPVALLTTALLALGSNVVYQRHPLSMDEYAAVFQSTIFSEGHLTGQLPPTLTDWLAPPWLQSRFIRMSPETGAAVSVYWPGFALLLAPFTLLGMPWLLNPVIGGATVLVMHRLGLALFESAECAGLVVLLALASPAFTVNAISYYAMPAHVLANALFVLLLLRPSPRRAFGAGLAGSLALVLHNPAPHLLFALPWLVWLALREDRLRTLAPLVAGYLPLSLLLGWGWSFFIESAFSSAAAAFAPAVSVENAYALLSARLQSVLGWTSETGHGANLYGLAKLWLWAVPGLVAVAALGAWRARRERGAWLALIGSVLLTYCAYFFVRFDQGHGWGFRYFHPAWAALPLLAVAALQRGGGRSSLQGYLAGSAMLSLVALTAISGWQVEHFIARQISQIPVAMHGTARVVIMDQRRGFYVWDLAQNDPFLRNPVVLLISRSPQLDAAMMAKNFPAYSLLDSGLFETVWGVPAR
jgi:hypothetical protein